MLQLQLFERGGQCVEIQPGALVRQRFAATVGFEGLAVEVVDAGAFDMSNNMTSVGQSAAGIMVAAQNSGMASLIQQGITVQANLTVGP